MEKNNFKNSINKNIRKLNWRFYWNNMRSEGLEEKDKFNLIKDLRIIYNSLPKSNKKEIFEEGWINVVESQNSKNLFEIPKILESENILPELMSKEIMNYWKNKALLEKYPKSMIEIIKIVKKYSKEFKSESSFVSSKVYELF